MPARELCKSSIRHSGASATGSARAQVGCSRLQGPARINPRSARASRNDCFCKARARLLTIFLIGLLSASPRPLEGRLSRGVAKGGTKRRASPEMRRRGSSGRGPAIPDRDRCGARGPVSLTGTRATSGLRPRPLWGLCQELADRGRSGDGTVRRSAARRRDEDAAMVRRETRRFRRRSRLIQDWLRRSAHHPPRMVARGQRAPVRRGRN